MPRHDLILNINMNALPALVGISSIVWVSIGILSHADWVLRIFRKESEIIAQQQATIEKYGYGAISRPRRLTQKNLFVFGYWGKDSVSSQEGSAENVQSSPAIFTLANVNLVAFTSITVLVVLSKGLFRGLGMF
ncbi:hypothetical protein [Synechococcus sp. MIT S1220]|uniref:hypothetical protein n=1 Tax=Synechococcus sp. MIT S1220 TaxID=3082549 RepID=UPI0039B0DB48